VFYQDIVNRLTTHCGFVLFGLITVITTVFMLLP